MAKKGKAITIVNTFKQNKTQYGRPMLDNQDLVKVSSKENMLKKGRYTVDEGTMMPEMSSQQQATTQYVSGRHESSLTKDTVGGSIFDNNN